MLEALIIMIILRGIHAWAMLATIFDKMMHDQFIGRMVRRLCEREIWMENET